MKPKIYIAAFTFVAAVALIAFSKANQKAFAPAEDFPRGALVYAQINDLPAFIKLWNESKFKEKYLESENFADFKNQHLGRKLASRRAEFNEASGFPIDLETIAGLAENRAAIALYDVGKLEFVFVAPVSDEIFAATKFAQNQDNFAAETLSDGTIVYRVVVAADRGRQKQALIFANARGRFVLATSEKLLAQTLSNIEGAKGKNSLRDEPLFTALTEKVEPHLATIWVNQTALNADYYFKRYWLMSKAEDLKNLRAGVFDLEMREGKFVEHRRFLLDENAAVAPLENVRARELLSFLPEDVPFYRLRTTNPKAVDETVEETIFERRAPIEERETGGGFYSASFDDDSGYSSNDYDSLNENFDETIDDASDDEIVERSATDVDFSKLLQRTTPKAVLTFAAPRVLPAPLFVRFDRAAIFSLNAPADFDSAEFEAAIARQLVERTMIAAPDARLNWESKTEDGLSRREIQLPMLGIEACYALRGRQLILANNAEFLRSILARQNSAEAADLSKPLTGLTIVDLERRENAYDSIFGELTKNKAADEFFTGNVSSLLDSLSDVGKIEIRENRSKDIFEEEIIVNFK